MVLADPYSRPASLSGATASKPRVPVKPRSGNSALQYQRSQIETASPTRLVILLHEGAIRFCQMALDAMARQDLAVQHVNLLKAQAIVAELLSSLNRDKGGDVAENLARLYTHMLEQLVTANLHDQPEPAAAVQEMLRDLRASWVEVEGQFSGEQAEEGNRESVRSVDLGTGERREEEKKRREDNPPSAIQNRLGNRNA